MSNLVLLDTEVLGFATNPNAVVNNPVLSCVAFDAAQLTRERNDQAYFLYLFTRLEQAISTSFGQLISIRSPAAWETAASGAGPESVGSSA